MLVIPVLGILHWIYCIDITINDPGNNIRAWLAVFPLMCVMNAIQFFVIHDRIISTG